MRFEDRPDAHSGASAIRNPAREQRFKERRLPGYAPLTNMLNN